MHYSLNLAIFVMEDWKTNKEVNFEDEQTWLQGDHFREVASDMRRMQHMPTNQEATWILKTSRANSKQNF